LKIDSKQTLILMSKESSITTYISGIKSNWY
jgi:hypothetical protein